MSVDLNFDANKVPPTSPFDPVPAGKYRAHVIESEVKPTANGQGKYLQLTWEILDGEFNSRKVWQRLNIVNENAQAQEIAQRELSSICHATGTLKIKNSSEVHHKPAIITVKVRQSAGFDPQNEIKKVENCDGSKPGAKPASVAGLEATAEAAGTPSIAPEKVPAWARKAS